MRPTETIKLRFAQPVSPGMLDDLAKRGWNFTQATDQLILYETAYLPGANLLPSIELALRELQWQPKIYHAISPNFEPADFEQAEFATISGPDEYADKLPRQTRKCPSCNKPNKPVRLEVRLDKFTSKQPCFVLNGEAFVISSAFAASLRASELTGYELAPLDSKGAYFQILATCQLLNQILEPTEMLDYRGICTACGWPQFKVFFGPGRLQRDMYAGEDFAWTNFFGGELLMSPRALTFFQSTEPSFQALRPVILQ